MSDELGTVTDSIEDAERDNAIMNRERLEAEVKDVWGYSATGIEAKKAAMTMLSTSTGMYAKVPLMCKGDSCPYAENCKLLDYGLAPRGELCPQETAMIELQYAGYSSDFDIDKASFTDRNMISTIIHYDVMIERVKSLISNEGVPVVDVVAGIGENGEAFYRPEVSKNIEVLDRFVKKRNEAYQLMMATRRDKKGEERTEDSLSKLLMEVSTSDFLIEERPDNLKD